MGEVGEAAGGDMHRVIEGGSLNSLSLSPLTNTVLPLSSWIQSSLPPPLGVVEKCKVNPFTNRSSQPDTQAPTEGQLGKSGGPEEILTKI